MVATFCPPGQLTKRSLGAPVSSVRRKGTQSWTFETWMAECERAAKASGVVCTRGVDWFRKAFAEDLSIRQCVDAMEDN